MTTVTGTEEVVEVAVVEVGVTTTAGIAMVGAELATVTAGREGSPPFLYDSCIHSHIFEYCVYSIITPDSV